MIYNHENDVVKISIDTDFDDGTNMIIQVHDKAMKKIHPLIMPEAIVLPMKHDVIAGLEEIFEEIKRSYFF